MMSEPTNTTNTLTGDVWFCLLLFPLWAVLLQDAWDKEDRWSVMYICGLHSRKKSIFEVQY